MLFSLRTFFWHSRKSPGVTNEMNHGRMSRPVPGSWFCSCCLTAMTQGPTASRRSRRWCYHLHPCFCCYDVKVSAVKKARFQETFPSWYIKMHLKPSPQPVEYMVSHGFKGGCHCFCKCLLLLLGIIYTPLCIIVEFVPLNFRFFSEGHHFHFHQSSTQASVSLKWDLNTSSEILETYLSCIIQHIDHLVYYLSSCYCCITLWLRRVTLSLCGNYRLIVKNLEV